MMRHRPDLCVGGTAAGGTTALPTSRILHLDRSPEQSNTCPSRTFWTGSAECRRAVESASPQRMSRSDASTRSRSKRPNTSSRMAIPATITGARAGSRPRVCAQAAPAGVPTAGPAVACRRSTVSTWPSIRVGVVFVEFQVDRGALRRACRRRRSRGSPPGARAGWTSARRAASSSRVGGSVWRWRSLWRTTPIWVDACHVTAPRRAEHELGRAAADVDHEHRRVVVARDVAPAKVSARLLVAGQDAGAGNPSVSLDAGGELGAVGRVADGRGHHRGAAARPPICAREARAGRRAPAAGRPRRAGPCGRRPPEAGDDRLARELPLAVGDQQARGVRADVDGGDPGHAARCGISSPFSAARRLSTAMSAIRERVRTVAEPTCGTTTRFGACSSGSSCGQRLGVGDVESGAGDLAVVQGLRQRRPGRPSRRARC